MENLKLKIAVDGFDGTGKTSLINKLVHEYEEKYSSLIERLIPSSVELFKKFANNTQNYSKDMSDQFRVIAYLWESYLRLELKKEVYDKTDMVFFDRWIFTNLTKPIDFKKDEKIVNYLISSMPKPDITFLIYSSEENIIKHLKEKNDWMLITYKEEEIIYRIHEFYNAYEELLKKFGINYIVIDGNTSIELMNTIMKREIDNLICGILRSDA